MIQIYPLLAFPLACVITWFTKTTTGRLIWIVLLGLNIYYSFWWVHQAHKGGFFQPGQMTKSYFFSVAGRLNPDPDLRKLLDTDEYFIGTPQEVNSVYENTFENDSLKCEFILPDSSVVACLNKDVQFYTVPQIILPPSCNEWIRLEGDFTVRTREWNVWNYTQWIVQFYNGEEVVKSNMIRLQRHIVTDNTPTHIFFDVKIPDADYDRCVINFWNADSANTILIDNLKASCFIK